MENFVSISESEINELKDNFQKLTTFKEEIDIWFNQLKEMAEEMKSLKEEIKSLDEMDTCFGQLTVNEIVKRQNAKNRLFYLIEKL